MKLALKLSGLATHKEFAPSGDHANGLKLLAATVNSSTKMTLMPHSLSLSITNAHFASLVLLVAFSKLGFTDLTFVYDIAKSFLRHLRIVDWENWAACPNSS